MDALDTAPCDGSRPPCDGSYLEVVGAAAEGEVCQNATTIRLCGSGAMCMNLHGSCYTCRPYTPVNDVGSTCNVTNILCASGLYCTPMPTGTCELRKGKDAPCNDSPAACRSPLECIGTSGSKTCRARPDIGESCEVGTCLADLACTGTTPNRTCTKVPVAGDSCTRVMAESCRFSTCVFSTPTAPTGTCVTTVPTASDGSPCTYNDQGLMWNTCGTGLYEDEVQTDGGLPQSCTCRTKKADGASCTNMGQCTSGFCYGGLCTALKPVGASCGIWMECASSNCVNLVCADPPPAPTCP